MSVENSNYFIDAERRARNLEAVLRVSKIINSSLDLDYILGATCQAAVELIGVSHSSLVMVGPDLMTGNVLAEFPEIGTRGVVLEFPGVNDETRSLESGEPVSIEDIAAATYLGRIQNILLELNIRSILIVPVLNRGRVLGYFSLDMMGHPHAFSEEEIEICKIFAAQVAIAISNAQLYEEARQKAAQLDALRRTTLSITSTLERAELLHTIVEQAVGLLKAKSGGIYEYHPEQGKLSVIIDYNQQDRLGMSLKVGEGMAGRLVQGDEPFLIADGYDNWPQEAQSSAGKRPFAAILEVTLKWREKIVGVLYIEDEVGRKFTAADAHLLSLFADQAAVALVNSEFVTQNRERLQRFGKISQAMQEIMGDLASMPLDERLTLIAKHATQILDAQICGIYLVKRPGFLSSAASYGRTEGRFHKGMEVAIHGGPGAGLTGHIAFEGKLFNACGSALRNHFAFPREGKDGAPSSGIHSLLAIPLKKKVGPDEHLLGVLEVENKKGKDEQPVSALGFDEEDEWILKIFAEEVVLAIEAARLVEDLREQKVNLEYLSQATQTLSGETPPGQILLNIATKAMESLEGDSSTIWAYDQSSKMFLPEEVVAVGISEEDLQEFRNVVPPPGGITHTVTREGWLPVPDISADFDFLKGKRVELLKRMGVRSFQGVALRVGKELVGVMYVNYKRPRYFGEQDRHSMENLAAHAALTLVIVRNAQLFEERAKKLSEQAALIALSQQLLGTLNVQEILDYVVAVAKRELNTDFCTIVLPDKEGRLLVAAEGLEGADIRPTEIERGTKSQTGYTIMTRRPVAVYDYDKEERFDVPRIVHESLIKSGVSVPMFRGGEVVGALLVHTRTRRYFSDAEVNLLSLIANQTAIALKSARQFEEITKRSAYLQALHEAGKAIGESSAGFERKKILDQIVEQAVKCLVDRSGRKAFLGTLQKYDPDTNELSFESAYPPEVLDEMVEKIGERRSLDRNVPSGKRIGIAGRAILDKAPQRVKDVRLDTDYFLFTQRTRSELAVPLLDSGNEALGVLNVESEQLDAFDSDDENMLLDLAKLAVVVIQNARQYEELKETQGRVGTRSAIAWMGMASSIWGHSVRGHAINIRELVKDLRKQLEQTVAWPKSRGAFKDKLGRIENLATRILGKPTTKPLFSTEGMTTFFINDFIEERVMQLRWNEPYSAIPVTLNLTGSRGATVLCSPEWLRRALDILIDNAVEAMANSPAPALAISANVVGDKVKIAVTDTGPGIPPEILPKIFNKQIEKPEGGGGSGVGLLMAQLIVQALNGEVVIERSGPEGTSMSIQLPLREI